MSASPIARRYARALSELCEPSKNHAVISKQLNSFATTWSSSPELRALLQNPVVSIDDKRKVLDAVFKKSLLAPTTRNFMMVLLESDRISDVEEIAAAFEESLDAATGRVRATVTTAVPMDRAYLTRIEKALARLTKSTVSLEAKVDPSVIGGVVTEIGNVKLDGTLKTQLEALSERLLAQ